MSDKWEVAGVILGTLAALAIVGFCIRDCRRQVRCEDAGGHVEHYNFRTVFVTASCGSGCTMLVPEQTSDWRCVGANPEGL